MMSRAKDMTRYLITVQDRESGQSWSYEAGAVLQALYVIADANAPQFMVTMRGINSARIAEAMGALLDTAVHVAGVGIIGDIIDAAGKSRIDESRIMHYGEQKG